MKHARHTAALLTALLMTSPGWAQTANTTSPTSSDRTSATGTSGGPSEPSKIDSQFVEKAASSGLAEVESGQMALKKASSQEVRQLGQMIMDDHSRSNDKLTAIASQKNLSAPKQPDEAERRKLARLQKLSGEAFDQALLKQEKEHHEEAIKLFSKEAQSGTDRELKQFASEALPTLRAHLQQVEALQKKLGVKD